MTWNLKWLFRINCFVKKIIFVNAERVMTLNCFRIDCIIEKLHLLCYWFLNIFSLHDLFETRSFICVYETSIALRYWHDCFRINCFIDKLHLQNMFERVIIFDVKLFESIVSLKKLHLSYRWHSNAFSLYYLIVICYSTCQRQCALINIWILNCFF